LEFENLNFEFVWKLVFMIWNLYLCLFGIWKFGFRICLEFV